MTFWSRVESKKMTYFYLLLYLFDIHGYVILGDMFRLVNSGVSLGIAIMFIPLEPVYLWGDPKKEE